MMFGAPVTSLAAPGGPSQHRAAVPPPTFGNRRNRFESGIFGAGGPAGVIGLPAMAGPGAMPPPMVSAPNMPPPEQPAQPDILASRLPQAGPLGGSMRQPFDYARAKETLMPAEQERPGTLRRIAQIAGPMLLAASGRGDIAQMLIQQQAGQRQARATQTADAQRQLLDWQRNDYEAQRDADLKAADPFTIGRDRLQFDPASGAVSTLYDGPEDFEQYAAELDLVEGSPEYFQAVEDFVLRSSGPSAHVRDLELDDHRTGNDRQLEGLRHSNRLGLEGVRQGNRVQLRGVPQARTPAAPRSARSGGGAGEPTATDAQGRTLVVRNGQWVPAN